MIGISRVAQSDTEPLTASPGNKFRQCQATSLKITNIQDSTALVFGVP